MTIAVLYTTLAAVKIKPEKNFRVERESNPDPAITGAVLSPVSYPSQLGEGQAWVCIIPINDEYIDMNMFETYFVLRLKYSIWMTIAVMYTT